MATDHRRSQASAAHARAVLRRLVDAWGTQSQTLVVIGGLAAPRLSTRASVPHEGTTDIDLLLEVAMDYDLDDDDYGWLEEGLLSVGAVPRRHDGTWRWHVDDVDIDLLCDRYPNEYHGELDLPGAPMATVMQLPGPAAARADSRTERVEPDDPDSPVVRVAGVGGYLLAKAAAAVGRQLERDQYDFWWVVLQGDGGPRNAVAALTSDHLRNQYARHFLAVRTLVNDGMARGGSAEAYAGTMVRTGSEDDFAVLLEDVVAAATILDVGLIRPS